MSLVDGPGNRTSVFVQGCNIACKYCHNPETQNLCINCGLCVSTCPAGALKKVGGQVVWDKDKCTDCDTCIKTCPHNASPKVEKLSAEQVFDSIKPNLGFIRGITVSGGECSLYPEFLEQLFVLARAAGLTCLMDSNGCTDLSLHPRLMEVCDGVMLDVKSWDPQVFRELCAGDNGPVKKNLAFLAHTGKLEELRVVCLPGHVDAEQVLQGMADLAGPDVFPVRLKLIRFRPFGVRGPLESYPSPDDGYMNRLRALAYELGFTNVIVV